MSSILAWLVKVILDWLAEKVFKIVEEQRIKAELAKKDAELLKRYNEAVSAGSTLSREERRRIAESLLNGELP